jgi:hypothetical protein
MDLSRYGVRFGTQGQTLGTVVKSGQNPFRTHVHGESGDSGRDRTPETDGGI